MQALAYSQAYLYENLQEKFYFVKRHNKSSSEEEQHYFHFFKEAVQIKNILDNLNI